MKKIFYIISFGIIAAMIVMASCGGDNGDGQLTPQQEQAQLLNGTWSHQNTTQSPDLVDPTILDQLSITFNIDANSNPTSFSSSGAPDFFVTVGSSKWAFSGSSTTSILLTDVSPVNQLTINSLTQSSLTLTFNFSSLRVAGLDGNYTVEMSK